MCYWSPVFLQVYVYSRFVWFIQLYFEEKQISLPYRGKKSGLFFFSQVTKSKNSPVIK